MEDEKKNYSISEPAVEKGKSQDQFLQEVFGEKKFTSSLQKILSHTKKISEGGIAVYKNTDGLPFFSDPVLTPIMRSAEMLWHRLEVDMEDLLGHLISGTNEDLQMVIHSHPVIPHSRLDSSHRVLRPSISDLEGWEGLRSKFPNIIEGIIVPQKDEALLLLFQSDPNRTQDTFYQQWMESDPISELFRLLEESGIRHDTLKFNIKSGEFSDEELKKLTKFATRL